MNLRQTSGDEIELETIKAWMLQSYCAIAPKKLAKVLDERE